MCIQLLGSSVRDYLRLHLLEVHYNDDRQRSLAQHWREVQGWETNVDSARPRHLPTADVVTRKHVVALQGFAMLRAATNNLSRARRQTTEMSPISRIYEHCPRVSA